MKKKMINFRTRQRQRMSRRMVIILSASFFLLICIGVTLFFNFSQSGKSSAKSGAEIQVLIAPEFQPMNEKTMDAPFVDSRLSNNPNTIYIRKAKPLHENAQTYLQ
ncbi:MAG: hypothetical protein IPJ66_05875 [Bacteroidetes bacterium]|nr:hypothetical protein [Bacteroidota bacterium]MBL0139176.1 hypothetical protein [Bacteroidota bacterium]